MASGESVRDMTNKFAKLEKFNGQDFRRWKKKMHFLLTTLKVVYVLSTPCPEIVEDETLEQTRRRLKWENDDYICRGHILNGMSDALFDVHQNDESARQLCDALESKYMAEDTSSKKFLVSNFMNYKMSDSRPVMEQYNELLHTLGQFSQHDMKMDESISVSSIIDKLPPSWKDFKHTLKHQKEDLNLVQLGVISELRNHFGLKKLIKPKDDEMAWWVDSGATSHVCKDLRWFEEFKPIEDGSVLRMGNVIESDKFILSKHGTFVGFGYLSSGMFKLNIHVPFASESVCIASSSSNKVNHVSSLWHARFGHVNYVRMKDMSKMSLIPAFDMHDNKCHTCKLTKITRKAFKDVKRDSKVLELIHSDLCDFHSTPSLGKKKYVVTYIDDAIRYCYVYLVHTKDEALDKFKVYKQEVELLHGDLIKTLRTDRGGEYYDPVYFQSIGIIHQTTAPYTPQQNGVAERKNRTLKEMVNSLLSYSGLNDGFWGEAMLTACYLLNRTPNKKNKITPYELWKKKPPNLNYLKVWGCRAIVRLTEPKRKNLGERGIDCIFIGYAENSKAYRFYVLEPNDYVSINTVVESRDAIFDEDRFTSMPRPKDAIQNSQTGIYNPVENVSLKRNDSAVVPTEPRKSNRARKAKSFGPDFHLYLVEGTRNVVEHQYQYCFNIEEDPKTYNEVMASRDVAFWKEAIQDEMDSIMHNNTWKLTDLPPGCKPLGCKWIFKRKMKVDGSIDKFKARLVIQGFRQNEGIDFFDTYAPVARISTIRLLIALASIHKLLIHQMDVKTAFLNGELDEEVYMKQPEGFVLPGQENKVCKLIKSLYGLKQAPKQWHQKFDDVILSHGFLLNQEDKCVYSRFDPSGKGVIICLYVDDMLIFGTDQDQIDKTKKRKIGDGRLPPQIVICHHMLSPGNPPLPCSFLSSFFLLQPMLFPDLVIPSPVLNNQVK
ncbi:hypothetical protein E3N88_29966 [Mikania micrantha]|uniref:Integrase catalytic domain-containing protein n=1 Tax=Mikania micrantha TaxID=192012 RepID=A0A5N6MKQ8_9ASTR|nr:hypothetical protein E3N88_29966 [Mikania micrantha]